jgi:hypothetical protein
MTRKEQALNNAAVIERLCRISGERIWKVPSYRLAVTTLNAESYTTSRGNPWTPKRLVRMLQRHRISGLWGIKHQLLALPQNQQRAFFQALKGQIPTSKKGNSRTVRARRKELL